MRVTNNFLISLAVLAFVFSVSLAWAFRGDLIPLIAAALDRIGISVGLKQAPKMADKKGTETFEKEINVEERSGIDQLVSELIGLEKSRRELNIKVTDLKDEIGVLESEIEELKYVIIEGKSELENDELEKELAATTDEDAGEEDLLAESEPANETSESRLFEDANNEMFREYVGFYVDWLTDAQSVASENQKAYICRNSNVSQFLAVNEDAALREACNITGYNRGIIRNNVTRDQKSFLCRNLNVTRFLSAFKNVAASDLCRE